MWMLGYDHGLLGWKCSHAWCVGIAWRWGGVFFRGWHMGGMEDERTVGGLEMGVWRRRVVGGVQRGMFRVGDLEEMLEKMSRLDNSYWMPK